MGTLPVQICSFVGGHGKGETNLNNWKNIKDISMKQTPFYLILKELSNDTKYIAIGPKGRGFHFFLISTIVEKKCRFLRKQPFFRDHGNHQSLTMPAF